MHKQRSSTKFAFFIRYHGQKALWKEKEESFNYVILIMKK